MTDPLNQSTVRGEEVTYQVGETELRGYIAWDANRTEPRPGIIVVHEWWGHTDFVRRRARMLAEAGYVAFALDMYGEGKSTDSPEEAQHYVMEAVGNPNVAQARFAAAVDLLKARDETDGTRIAAIGYCFGGAVALQMARLGAELAAVASFHGTLSPQGPPASSGVFKAKALVLHGADDPLVPREQLEAFKREMDAAGVDYRIVEYAGATHAFTNPTATERGKQTGLPLAYDEAADTQSWAELLTFLSELFGAP